MPHTKRALLWVKLHAMMLIALLLLLTLALSLIHPLWASFYNRPYSDDYSFGVHTHKAWQQTGSLFKVLTAAAHTAVDFFYNWQGTFSAIFAFSLQPGIFSEQAYFVSTFLLIFSLLFAIFYFLHALLIKRLSSTRFEWLVVSSLVSLYAIQFPPYAAEAFYWYNGGIYYTFFFAVHLVLLGKLLKVREINSLPGKILSAILIVLLSTLVSGSNFLTALLAVLTGLCLCAVAVLRKEKNSWMISLSLLVLLAGLMISATAPGNAYRQLALLNIGREPLPIFATILESFREGFRYARLWMRGELFCMLMLLSPVLLRIAARTAFRFRFPLLVVLFAFCLFCAQMAPVVMTRVLGQPSHMNILYDSYLLLVLGAWFYVLGWGRRVFLKRVFPSALFLRPNTKPALRILSIAAAILLLVSGIHQILSRDWLSKAALRAMNDQGARHFAVLRDERQRMLEDPTKKDVVVPGIWPKPDIFLQADLQDRDWWINQVVATYYGKDHIWLEGTEGPK